MSKNGSISTHIFPLSLHSSQLQPLPFPSLLIGLSVIYTKCHIDGTSFSPTFEDSHTSRRNDPVFAEHLLSVKDPAGLLGYKFLVNS